MKKEDRITISKELRDEMITEIKDYFSSERNEEIGDLSAGLMLDFIIERLAPGFYNRGVDDAYRYMKESAEDLLSIRI
ncbi:MAG: DUF2164 domain-containing protein [Methanomicrobiales archaeon]|nr:DUF2164 domain-containing protein [Methanomicrobiales archaeon]